MERTCRKPTEGRVDEGGRELVVILSGEGEAVTLRWFSQACTHV